MSDLISRQAAIDVAVQSIKDWDRMFMREANCRIRDAINGLPSAQPINKGLWVKQELAPQTLRFCSLCGCKKPRGVMGNFCSNCGAKMG